MFKTRRAACLRALLVVGALMTGLAAQAHPGELVCSHMQQGGQHGSGQRHLQRAEPAQVHPHAQDPVGSAPGSSATSTAMVIGPATDC